MFSDDCWKVAIYPWPASSDQWLSALETLDCDTASKELFIFLVRTCHINWVLFSLCSRTLASHNIQLQIQTPVNQCWLLVWRRVFLNYNRQNNNTSAACLSRPMCVCQNVYCWPYICHREEKRKQECMCFQKLTFDSNTRAPNRFKTVNLIHRLCQRF